MKPLTEMKEQHTQEWGELRQILDAATLEKRDLTSEESQLFSSKRPGVEALKKQIDAREGDENIKRQISEMFPDDAPYTSRGDGTPVQPVNTGSKALGAPPIAARSPVYRRGIDRVNHRRRDGGSTQ